MQLVGLADGKGGKIQKSAWGIVSQHIIHFVIICFQIRLTERIFFLRGHLFLPPVDPRLPVLPVGAFGSAEAQVLFAFQLQHAAPADMVHIAAQRLHPAAELFLCRIFLQQIVIFMASIQKQQRVRALAQPVQLFLLLFASVPHKAKISQNDHRIPFAQPAQFPVPEAVDVAVGVACQIYHSCPSCRV